MGLIDVVESRIDVRADLHGAVQPQHDVTSGQTMLAQTKHVPRPPPHAVAVDRASQRALGNHQPEPGKAGAVWQRDHFDDPDASATAAPEHELELLRCQQSLLTGEPVRRGRRLRAELGQRQTQLMR